MCRSQIVSADLPYSGQTDNYNFSIIMSIDVLPLLTGVSLRINESVLITEGGIDNVCVTIVSDHFQARERAIHVLFIVKSNINTSSKCILATN